MSAKTRRAAVRALLGATALSLLATAASAQTFSRVVSFGDSLTDNGNFFKFSLLTKGVGSPPAPYFQGRFSNGPTYAERLAATINAGATSNFFTPIPGLTNNVNYAFGGARTDTVGGVNGLTQIPSALLAGTGITAPVINAPPGVPVQIESYLNRSGPTKFGSNDLVTVFAGANNIFNFLDTSVGGANDPTKAGFILPTQASITVMTGTAAQDVANSVKTLSNAGARTIVVPNLPDIGATPSFNGTTAGSQAGSLATFTFNQALTTTLSGVAASSPGTNIILVDTFGLFSAITANPSAFGYANVTASCVATVACVTGSAAVQNTYLFWDGVHPTATGQALFAAALQQYIYAPTLALYSGSIAEVVFGDRRAAAMRGLERLRDHRLAPERNDYYVSVVGDFGKLRTTVDRQGYDWQAGGVNFGFTRGLGSNLTAGLAGTVTTGSVSAGNTVSYDATNFSGDVLLGWRSAGFFVNSSFGAGAATITDWKRKTFIGPLENKGTATGYSANALLEGGYDAKFGAVTLTPAARLGFIHASSVGFTENGIVAPIKYSSRDIDAVTGAVELRAAFDVVREPNKAFSLFALAGYEDYLSYSRGAVRGVLANHVSQPFATAIGRAPGEGLQAGVGINGEIGNVRLFADYRASFATTGGNNVRHRANVGVKYAF